MRFAVTPYAGVWIEIYANHGKKTYLLSLPTRECGLKLPRMIYKLPSCQVTPYAGVWIEISVVTFCDTFVIVTPYAGVWIEIRNHMMPGE